MKLFVVVSSLLVAGCTGQLRDPKSIPDDESRTRVCEEGEGLDQTTPAPDALPALARGSLNPAANAGAFSQGLGALGLVGRGKRQAGDRFNPDATPFEWFTTNGESITKEECASRNATAEATGDPEQRISYRGPVFVQRGVYDVCVKFDKAPTWFFTKGGSNAGCDPSKRCCEWFPPYNNPCSAVNGIFWWETDAETSCTDALDLYYAGKDPRELFGVEYIYGGKKGEIRSVCHVTNPDEFVAGEEPELLKFDVEVTYCGEKCCIYEKL